MKIWLLRPIKGSGAWEPWYDKCFGFVIRAETSDAARSAAAKQGGDENPLFDEPQGSPWLDSSQSSCVQLTADGKAGLVIQDFHAA